MRGRCAGAPVALASLVWALAVPSGVRAELFSWVDADGVVHFTNIAGRKPAGPQDSNNTFLWEDNAGQLKQLHRVDVGAYDGVITTAAVYYSLPPALVKAVIAVESNFEPQAVSHAGALGLMQLLPTTAREVFVADPFDATDNIYGGTRYLRILANRFGGDVRLTLAAYNAGPDVVERAHAVPNIAETQAYVRRVLVLYRHYLSTWKADRK